ncbi:MAG: 50S ribosomal protein L10 [Candidatus Omnitrophica bacterium]|nr:50S ribosomal protein L10 [Candidatus Omnitrophota bacterium]
MPSVAKELMLDELVKTLESKNYVFFTRHQGLSAPDFVELRRKLEKVSDRTLVVKNTLTRRAFKKLGVDEVDGIIKGSILLTVAEKEPQLVSKVLVEFAKGRENFTLDGAYLEGRVVPAQFLKSLANLPSREVLIASLLGSFSAPIGGFVNILGQLVRSLAVVLDQIQKTKVNISS